MRHFEYFSQRLLSRRAVRKSKHQDSKTKLHDVADNVPDENRFDVVNLTDIGSGNRLDKKINSNPGDVAICIDGTDAQLTQKNECNLPGNSKANGQTASIILSPSSATTSASTKQAQALENDNDAEKKLNQPAETSPSRSPPSVGQDQLKVPIASDSSGCILTNTASIPPKSGSRNFSVRGTLLPLSIIV